MADLSAVLRKTIDGLPGSSPQLRAKVYDKARSAIDRQIAAANPPLGEEAAQARRDSLEDAIRRTEAHYAALEAEPETEGHDDPEPASAPYAAEPMTPAAPAGHAVDSVGEIGPSSPSGGEARHADDNADRDRQDTAIPAPDMAAPRYPSARRASAPERKSRAGLYAGVALLLIAGGAGAAYMSGSDFGGLLPRGGQQDQTAEQPIEGTDSGETPDASVAETPPEATPPTEDSAEAPPAAVTQEPGARDYTQRLLPDGTETDPGPGTSTANAFDEGTDVAAASEAAPTAPAASPAGQPAPAAEAVVPEGAEVAVFYEERFNDTPGAQHQGNVRWSVIEEAPADGQPPEPAVRAVVQIPDTSVTMTMTIRRNADATLPASHVIEMMFDVPENFPGGEIANVQRLAFKPTEQDRGRPLIGVAGKISDGFFWIALNDLQQAVQDNLSLMANEKWIDVPLAYETGQRALLSIEKGPEGEAAFRQALAAWDART